MLGKKQKTSHDEFQRAFDQATTVVSRTRIDDLVDIASREIRKTCEGKRTAFCWSGGKDSIALRLVCEAAGITRCMIAINRLEFPAFLRWVTDHMPDELEVIDTGQDLDWLARNREMIFPRNATTAGKWFQIVQHAAQRQFAKRRAMDVLILGRRRADGNFVGRDKENAYTSRGVTRYSPICDWTHEEVLASIRYYDLPLPPTYSWPRGWRVGTGCWPARQWTESPEHGWRETWEIDPSIVVGAAEYLPEAEAFLSRCA